MKKVFIVLMMALLAANVNAQDHYLVSEEKLSGEWKLDWYAGDWENSTWGVPKKIGLNNGKQSYYDGNKSQYVVGWFVSNYNKLHLVHDRSYDGYTGISFSDFIIVNYSEETMTLKTYDGKGLVQLKRVDTSNLGTIQIQRKKDSMKYDLQGKKVEDPEGIYIQNGQKFIAK